MTVAEIKHLLRPVFERYGNKIVSVYLFGSAADTETHPRSDIDIAVLLSESAGSFFELKLSLYADLSRALKRNDIDLVILNETDNLILLDQIIRRGVILVDRNKDRRAEFECRVIHRVIDFKSQRAMTLSI